MISYRQMQTRRDQRGRSIEMLDAILHSTARISKCNSFTAIASLTDVHTYTTLSHLSTYYLFYCARLMVSCELQRCVFVYRSLFQNIVHVQVCQVLYYTSLGLCFSIVMHDYVSTKYPIAYQHSRRNQPTRRCFK